MENETLKQKISKLQKSQQSESAVEAGGQETEGARDQEPAQSAGETEERPDEDQTGGLMECNPQAGAMALEDTYQKQEDSYYDAYDDGSGAYADGNKGTSTS